MILYSGYVLYDSFATELNAFSANSDLLRYKPVVMAEPSDTTPSLADVNEDYRAWITVTDSPIDYPVVQGKDDLYYAAHDVYRESSLTGAIYLAAANSPDFSDSYNLLYGHHMDNGAMFGSLDRFMDRDYFRSHQMGIIVSESGIYDITFFAAIRTDAYESRVYRVGDRAGDVISFLTGSRSRRVSDQQQNGQQNDRPPPDRASCPVHHPSSAFPDRRPRFTSALKRNPSSFAVPVGTAGTNRISTKAALINPAFPRRISIPPTV
jgi:sortase B